MKTTRISRILLLTLVVAGCRQAPEIEDATEPASQNQDIFEVPWGDRDYQEQAWLVDSFPSGADLSNATEYRMKITIPEDFSTVTGRELIHYTNNESAALEAIYLRLFPNLSGGEAAVNAVTIDNQAVDPITESQNSAVRLPLQEPLSPGDAVTIALEFEVTIPREMGGNYGLFGYFDGFLVLDTFYPMIPAYDDEGWQTQATPPNGDPTYNDISFYLVQVLAPERLTLYSTGTEVDRREQNGEQLVTYASGPARDYYLAASEDLELHEQQVGQTTVRSYAPEQYNEYAELALDVGVRALEIFGARFGAYPYPEMELIGTPMQALGIEYPGVMGIRSELYNPSASIGGAPARIYLISTVAHEVAHQWFYNVVGNDQVEEPWLDEALAQYATYLYYREEFGAAAASGFQGSWYDRWDRTDRAAIPIGMPAGSYQADEYGSIVYGRGPIFIETLQETMGSEEFDEFLNLYVQQHAWGIATSGSFKALAESTCDCNLDVLFGQWVEGED